MVPGGGLGRILGAETGKAAALVSVLPGADEHELPGVELPSADAVATVPVVLPVTEPMMVTGMPSASQRQASARRRGTRPWRGDDGAHWAHHGSRARRSACVCRGHARSSLMGKAPPRSASNYACTVAIPMAVEPMVETWAGQLPTLSRSATVTQKGVRIQGSRRSIDAARPEQRERRAQLTFGL
jgi:hypothetical protein